MAQSRYAKSIELFNRAQSVLAGGVNSVARFFPPTFESPVYFTKGEGSHVWDVDGNEYVDHAMAYGPLIHGHRNPVLTQAVVDVLQNCTVSFGICAEIELEAAEKIVKHMPAVDRVRFTNSGSEAVMGAVRLARGFMGKEKILRFEGHYHGWTDIIHWNTRSPIGAIGLPNNVRLVPATPGEPAAIAQTLTVCPWNNLELLETALKRHGNEIAAVISEPLMCNLGGTAAKEGYLRGVRQLCDKYDVLLIFDEVITGFRLGMSGAQGLFGIKPDLTTMAKAIGGGYPVGAFGGREDIMALLGHGSVTHAGTYNGNVQAMAAVKSCIGLLERPGTYEKLTALGDRLRAGLTKAAKTVGIPGTAQGIGPVAQMWFRDEPVTDYRDGVSGKYFNMYPYFSKAMYDRGVCCNPAQTGVWYISTAHTEKDIDFTVAAAEDAMREIKSRF